MSDSLPNPYTVSFASQYTHPHVAAFSEESAINKLVDYINELGGNRDVEWFVLPTYKAVESVIQRIQEMGGISYYLQVDGPRDTGK